MSDSNDAKYSGALILKTKSISEYEHIGDYNESVTLSKICNSFFGNLKIKLVESRNDVVDAALQFSKKSIQLLIFYGHGTRSEICLSSYEIPDISKLPDTINLRNIELLIEAIYEKLHEKCVIICVNCAPEGPNLLSKKMHQLTGKTICAVEDSILMGHQWFLIRDEDNRLKGHFFNEEGMDITGIWENGKLTTFRDRSISFKILEDAKLQGFSLNFEDISITRLRNMIENQNHSYSIVFTLAMRYFSEDDIENGIKFLNFAITSDLPTSPKKRELSKMHVYYWEGVKYLSTKKWDDAFKCFNRMTPEYLSCFINKNRKFGLIEKLTECFRNVADLSRTDASIREKALSLANLSQGNIHCKNGQWDEAMNCYSQVLPEHVPDILMQIEELGVSQEHYFKTISSDESVQHSTDAFMKEKALSLANFSQGKMHCMNGQWDEAMNCYSQVLPEHVPDILTQIEELGVSQEHYFKTIPEEKALSLANFSQGKIHCMNGQWDEAMNCYSQVLPEHVPEILTQIEELGFSQEHYFKTIPVPPQCHPKRPH